VNGQYLSRKNLIKGLLVVPRYKYKGYDAEGSMISDVFTAADRSVAVADLSNLGILVLSIKPVLLATNKRKVVSFSEFYRFNQELLTLSKAGIPLVEAIEMCSSRPSNAIFSDILLSVKNKIREGQSHSEVCQQYPEAFDDIYIATLKTSEQTGDLVSALQNYQGYFHRKQKIQSEIKHALYYPIFLLAALFIVIAVLFIFVIPSFSELYDSFGAELPLATRIILSIANVMPLSLIIVIVLIVISTMVWRVIDKPPSLMITLDNLLNKLPIFGPIRYLLQQSRIMRMLSGMLTTGTALVGSLKVVSNSFAATQIGYSFQQVARSVEQGKVVRRLYFL